MSQDVIMSGPPNLLMIRMPRRRGGVMSSVEKPAVCVSAAVGEQAESDIAEFCT